MKTNMTARLLLVGLAGAALCPGARSQNLDYNKIEITTDQIAPNLYMLSGSAGLDPSHEDAAGGRIGVLAGPDGILMVDAGLPVVTYGLGEPVRLHLDNEIVDLVPIRAAHTGGDTMIRFEKANAIMIGDYYRNYGYPFIDINNGGSLKGMLEALDFTMKAAGPDTRLVPGHGTLIKRADLIPYRDMIFAIQGKVAQLIQQGKSLQDVLAAHVTAPFDASVPGGLLPAGAGTSADRFITEVYQELKGGK